MHQSDAEALARIKGEIKTRLGVSVAQREGTVWSAWRDYYRDHLYTPSSEPHETAVAQTIMLANSPSEALRRIQEYHERFPSSVGADAGEEFLRLYNCTRDAVARRGGITPMSGWIQTKREKHSGV